MLVRALLALLFSLAFFSFSYASGGGEVVGDSLGVGVGWASKLPSRAKISVSIQSGAVLEQLRQAERGDTVFMSLGTNDAVGGALNVKTRVDAIVKAADDQGINLVWIGPPCVFKPWDESSKKLDAILAEELKDTSVKYVSMRDDGICDHSLRAGDGVHFSMEGYSRMWQRAASAAGFPAQVAKLDERPTATEAHKPVHLKRKHHVKKSHITVSRADKGAIVN
jgi:hypothetical protein